MKAVVYSEYGSTEVLSLQELEQPQPGDNEVLIQVYAASVNSWDWDLVRGQPYLTRLGAWRKPRFKVLGADIAGRVAAVGRAVTRFQPGDEVFGDLSGCSWGGFAQYVCARETALTLKPAGLSFEEAAAIPQAAVLALQALRDKGKVGQGQRVLINGAGGGVGTFAVQLAKLYGASHVTCVDSGDKLAMLRSVGADEVIDYQKADFTQGKQQYDLILDVVGNRSVFAYSRALNRDGAYVMIGGSMSLILQILLLGPLFKLIGRKRIGILMHKPNHSDQQALKELAESRQVVPVIDRAYPLSGVAEGIRHLAEGRSQGKVVIRVEHERIH